MVPGGIASLRHHVEDNKTSSTWDDMLFCSHFPDQLCLLAREWTLLSYFSNRSNGIWEWC